MKKLLVKIKVIDIPYSPAVEAIPQKWTKEVDGEIISFYEQPLKVVDAQMVNDESYTYHPDVAAIPEVLEVSHEEIIAQTQGLDEELAQWLAGDSFKYPEGYWVEYVDISLQVEQDKINAEALSYLASTDWLIVREVETQVPCPLEVKELRAAARLKVVR
jgi:hypothetical protein